MVPAHKAFVVISYRVRICFIALLTGLMLAPIEVAAEAKPLDPVDVAAFFDELMAAQLERYRIPGAVVAVVSGGEVLLAKGYGNADLEQGRPMDPARTLIRPGSAAKPVTWTAVMQLVEQGALDLHTDINEYLDFAFPATFPEPITLAHLMTHTPGFEDVGEALFLLNAEELMPLGDYLKRFQPARVYAPGQVAAYSNYGTALAAYIIERVTGEPFDAYVENQIFAPLGMTRSTLRQPLPTDLATDLASGYGFHNDTFVKGGFEFVGPYPAGSMSAPALDMAPFMIAHLQEGRFGAAAILRPETVQEMHRRQYTPDPRLHGMTYGFMERTLNGQRLLYHDGNTNLFRSGLYLLPQQTIGIFVSYNGPDGIVARPQLLRSFMDRYFPTAMPATVTPTAETRERLAPYTGEYHLARAEFSGMGKVLRPLMAAQVSASPEGHLLLSFEGVTQPYVEVEPGLYRHQQHEELLVFHTDAAGTTWLALDGGPAFDIFNATTAFRAPWYETAGVILLLLLATLLLFVSSIIGWSIGVWRRRTRAATPWLAQVARGFAIAFGVLFCAYLVAFVAMLGDVEPAYGAPRVLFGPTPLLTVVQRLAWVLTASMLSMVICAIMAWIGAFNDRRPYWPLRGRLHYTSLAALACAVIVCLWYWNLLA